MTPGKAGLESCIHAVVKGADNTVGRLKAADFFSFPLDGGGKYICGDRRTEPAPAKAGVEPW
jgi:hypothetical protein